MLSPNTGHETPSGLRKSICGSVMTSAACAWSSSKPDGGSAGCCGSSYVNTSLRIDDQSSINQCAKGHVVNGRGSAEQGWDGNGFEPVIGRATARHLAAKGRALPRLDQQGGEFGRVEVRANATGAALAGTHTCGESPAPAVEDARELGADRLARSAEFQREIADEAAEQEIACRVFVGKCMEEALNSVLRPTVRIEDRQQSRLDV